MPFAPCLLPFAPCPSLMPLLIVVLSMLLAGLVRLRLLQIPLERDEGGFAYIGQHLFSEVLYTDLLDNKLPGLYGLYAIFIRLFGYNAAGIHLGLLVCNLSAIWLMYKLFGRIFNPWAGAVAASVFALTSLSPNVYGFAAHANQLLMPFALGALILLDKGLQNRQILNIGWAGLLLGLAFIIKQQVVMYGVFAGIWLLWLRLQERASTTQIFREMAAFTFGSLLPFGLICLYFLAMGRFQNLWLWVVELPVQLSRSDAIGDRWNVFRFYFSKVLEHFELIWGLAALGWLCLLSGAYEQRARVFGLLFPLFCLASALVGIAYYQHYFVLCLPAVAMLTGISVDAIRTKFTENMGNKVAAALVVLLVLIPVLQNTDYYIRPDFVKIHRQSYGMNPFPELQQVGEELGRRTLPGDQIGILGSEPEVLVYSRRNSATGLLFLYNLFSRGQRSAKLQEQYLDDLRKNEPAYLVWITETGSWGSDYASTDLFKNIRSMIDSDYVVCGKAEAFGDGRTGTVVWDEVALEYTFQGDHRIYIYKRR